MDLELIKELNLIDEDTLNSIAQIQRNIIIYEKTLKAMGYIPVGFINQSISHSQITYNIPQKSEYRNDNLPEYN